MSRNLLSLSLTACLLAGPTLADVPKVAVDIAPVHSLVARVMADLGTPDLIVQPGATPHEYSLRPSEAQALQDADLVFWVGPDLTPWMEDAVETLASEAEVTTLTKLEETTRLPMRETALFEAHNHGHETHEEHGQDEQEVHGHDHDEHKDHADHDDQKKHEDHSGHDDHAHDDHGEDHDHSAHDHGAHDHGAYDPHIWLAPANASAWLDVIAAKLSEADPENAEAYNANAAAGQRELAALTQDINDILAPVRDGTFIVFHDAYQYFEQSFDIAASGAISISDASDPSPGRIAQIQARVAEQGVSCVLSEPQFSSGVVSTVMEGANVRTGVIDPMGTEFEPGPALYPQMLRVMATALAACL